MGFFDRRFMGVRRAIANLFQNEADPEMILEQTLWDMERKLIQMRRAVAQAIASFKRADRQRQEALIAVQRWQNRAQMALNYGDEMLAKEAIARSYSYEKIATNIGLQGQGQQTFITDVRRNLQDLEEKINQIKLQKAMYVARIRGAMAQQQLHRLKEELEGGALNVAIADLETSLWQVEAENSLTDSLEAKFLALEKKMNIQD